MKLKSLSAGSLEGITKAENFEYNWRRLNKLYEEYLFNCDYSLKSRSYDLGTPDCSNDLVDQNNLGSPDSLTFKPTKISTSDEGDEEDVDEDFDDTSIEMEPTEFSKEIEKENFQALRHFDAEPSLIEFKLAKSGASNSKKRHKKSDLTSSLNSFDKKLYKNDSSTLLMNCFIDERIFLGERFITAQINTPTKIHQYNTINGERFSSAKKKLATLFEKRADCSSEIISLTPILSNEAKVGSSRKFLVNKCKSTNFAEETIEQIEAHCSSTDNFKRKASVFDFEDSLESKYASANVYPTVLHTPSMSPPLLSIPSMFEISNANAALITSPFQQTPNRQIRKIQLATSPYAQIKDWLFQHATLITKEEPESGSANSLKNNVQNEDPTGIEPRMNNGFDIWNFLKCNVKNDEFILKLWKRLESCQKKFSLNYACPIKDEFMSQEEKRALNLDIFDMGCALYFCLLQHVLKIEKFGLNSDITTPSTTPISSAQDKIATAFVNSINGIPSHYYLLVMSNDDLNLSLLALALEVTCFTYEAKYRVTTSPSSLTATFNNRNRLRDNDITSRRQLSIVYMFGLQVYTFYRVIELSVRAVAGTDIFTRDTVKYLNDMEELILEKLVWQSDSQIWQHIHFPGHLNFAPAAPTTQGQASTVTTSTTTHPSDGGGRVKLTHVPSCKDVFNSRNIEYIASSSSIFTPPTVLKQPQPPPSTPQQHTTADTPHSVLSYTLATNFTQSKAEVTPICAKNIIRRDNEVVAVEGVSSTNYQKIENKYLPMLPSNDYTDEGRLNLGKPVKYGSLALFFRKVYHLASLRTRDLCNKLELTSSSRALDANHLIEPMPSFNFKLPCQSSSNNTTLTKNHDGKNVSGNYLDPLLIETVNITQSLPVTSTNVPVISCNGDTTSPNFDLTNLRFLFSPAGSMNGPNSISNLLLHAIWTCFEYCLMYHTRELFVDRHIDQIIMCCIYIITKVTCNERSFAEIMKYYRTQPQSNSQVYRCVLLSNPITQYEPTNNTEGDNHDSKLLNLKPRAAPVLLTPTKQNKCALINTENGAVYGDIIKFYNQVFVDQVKSFALKFVVLGEMCKGTIMPNNDLNSTVTTSQHLLFNSVDHLNSIFKSRGPIDSLLSPIPIPSQLSSVPFYKNSFGPKNGNNFYTCYGKADSNAHLTLTDVEKIGRRQAQLAESPYRKRVAANLFISPLKKPSSRGSLRFLDSTKNTQSDVWGCSLTKDETLSSFERLCQDDIYVGLRNSTGNIKNALVYTFNQSPSKDLDKINQMVRDNHLAFLSSKKRILVSSTTNNDSAKPNTTSQLNDDFLLYSPGDSSNGKNESILKKLKLNFMLNKNFGSSISNLANTNQQSNIVSSLLSSSGIVTSGTTVLSAKKSLQF